MKNKEKFAKEIIEAAICAERIGVNKYTAEIKDCYEMSCGDCLFCRTQEKGTCGGALKVWANAEYKEPKQFTDREKAFVKLFPEIKYLARDDEGKLFAYRQKPFKDEEEGWWTCKDDSDILFEISFNFGDFLKFSSIQWEDEEPTSRKEILGG